MKKKVQQIKELAEGVRALVRGSQGLPIEQDQFSGLLDVKDIRERTRLTRYQIRGHTYMRLLHEIGGEEWDIMGQRAEMKDHYMISEGGEQRKEAILMTRAKSEVRLGSEPLSIPPVETKQESTKKKKHWWSKEASD